MSTAIYNHLYYRVEYPLERGYRMLPKPLPHYMHISITDDSKGSKHLTVHSRIHVNKEVKVGPSYSAEFSDNDIIKDLTAEIHRRFIGD